MDWNGRVLQDLVYERVRSRVDLLSLVELERDLADSVEGALEQAQKLASASEAARASRGLIDQAWRRLEQEWRELRDSECPLCALCSGPYECPAPVE
jgi:hypothetical protein